MPGIEQGLFPYLPENSTDALQHEEEERRLFYVGMTRAKDRLYLLHARSRLLFGQKRDMAPSRFLHELPQELVKKSIMARAKKKDRPRQMKLFA
jgi:DNA helicase-2/ATP-dependent DNA helicase PcrA